MIARSLIKIFACPFNYLAILAILTESCLSAFTGVYTQWLFEGDWDTLWIRNVQLSFLSLLVYGFKVLTSTLTLPF